MPRVQQIKTTLSFNSIFHHHLKFWAKTTNKGMAQIIEDELLPILKAKQRERQRRIFAGMRRLAGVIDDPTMADAAATADDYLYGSRSFENPYKQEQRGK